MKSIQEETLLVIPYIAQGQGNELFLSVSGWMRFYSGPLHIVVIGDDNERVRSTFPEVEFIIRERAKEVKGQYHPNIDVANKLDYIYELFHDKYDHFVLANDDEYPIREFDHTFLTKTFWLQDRFVGNISKPSNFWIHDMAKTRIALDKEGMPHKNYCNHHPYYFEMEKFHDMSVKFDLKNNSMIRNNLYYNIYPHEDNGCVNEVRFGVWSALEFNKLDNVIKNENIKFVCNSNNGWSQKLEDKIYKIIYSDVKKEEVQKPVQNSVKTSPNTVKTEVSKVISVVDKIDFNEQLKCKNRLHILIVNLNQLNLTQHIINDLLVQDEKFDLTVFDQGSTENGTKRYLADLKEKWPLENCCLNVIENSVNAPLNHVWNWFNKYTDNEFLAYFNNDIVVCDNIVSDAIKIFDKEEDVSIISHPTNKKEFTKSNELEYELEKNYLQGWDFIIRKSEYREIPNELWIYSGDVWIFEQVFKNKKLGAYNTSSPIIHYFSKTINTNKAQIAKILTNDMNISKSKYRHIQLDRNNKKYIDTYIDNDFVLDKTKKVIVSFTSWEKRIHNVPTTLSYMMNQTKRPDKIVLNLSEEEFKGKEYMLDNIKKLEQENPIFELNMIPGPNTKVWKKIIPTLERYKNDLIISIDDDIIYPNNFIEQFLLKYNEKPYTPITGINKIWYGLHHCSGAFNLMQWKFLSIYINDWKDIWTECNSSDTFYNFIVNLNGYSYTHSNINYFDNIKVFNEIDGWSKKCMKKENFTVATYKTLINKYGLIKNLNIKVK